MTFTGDQFDALSAATSNFAINNTDPKAAIIAEFNTLEGLVICFCLFHIYFNIMLMHYESPSP